MPAAFPLGNIDRARTLRPPRGTGELRERRRLRAALLPAGQAPGHHEARQSTAPPHAAPGDAKWAEPTAVGGARGGASHPQRARRFQPERLRGARGWVAMSRLHRSRWVWGRGGPERSVARLLANVPPLPRRIADFQEVLGEPTVALGKLRDLCFSGEWGGGVRRGAALRVAAAAPPAPILELRRGGPAGAEPYRQ